MQGLFSVLAQDKSMLLEKQQPRQTGDPQRARLWRLDVVEGRMKAAQQFLPRACRRALPGKVKSDSLRHHFRLLFQLFRLEVSDQRVDDRLEFAVHHVAELVECQTDAMI